MIESHSRLVENPWYRAALAWFLGLLLCLLTVAAACQYAGIDVARLWPLALAAPQGAFLLCSMGEWTSPPSRVIGLASLAGVFGYLPVLVGLFVPMAALLIDHVHTTGTIALPAGVAFALTLWIVMNIRQGGIAKHEFEVEQERLVMHRMPTPAIPRASVHASEKLIYWISAALAFGIPMAYLIPHLADEYANRRALLLQVAVLTTPFAVHLLGHLSRAACLWLYTVRRLERQHGKPMHLEQARS